MHMKLPRPSTLNQIPINAHLSIIICTCVANPVMHASETLVLTLQRYAALVSMACLERIGTRLNDVKWCTCSHADACIQAHVPVCTQTPKDMQKRMD